MESGHAKYAERVGKSQTSVNMKGEITFFLLLSALTGQMMCNKIFFYWSILV